MAAYDNPDFKSPMPGTDDVTRDSGQSAPGSAEPGQVPGMTGTTTDSAYLTRK